MKRTLIITDPGYIDSECIKESPFDDNYIMGIHFLVNRYDLFGDWTCMCYRGDVDYEKLAGEWSDISDDLEDEEYEAKKEEWLKKYCYGEFCADSGNVCVAYLDEVLKEYPDFKKWMNTHTWCFTLVPDFEGVVEEVVENDEDLHFVGKDKTGKVVFWTTQI